MNSSRPMSYTITSRKPTDDYGKNSRHSTHDVLADKHCRFLHRRYSPSALLFTEMITTGALLFGKQYHLLDFNRSEHPVAVQLGGNDPRSGRMRCDGRGKGLRRG